MKLIASVLYQSSSSHQHSFSWQSYGIREDGKHRFAMEDETCRQPSANSRIWVFHQLSFAIACLVSLLDAVPSLHENRVPAEKSMTSDKRERN
jgi:hypothetical protein